MGERSVGGRVVFEPVIDLVGDEPEPMALARLSQLLETIGERHRAGRIVGARKQETGGTLSREPLDVRDGRNPAPLS